MAPLTERGWTGLLLILAALGCLAAGPEGDSTRPSWTYRIPFPVRVLAVSETGVTLVGSDFGNYLHALDVVSGRFLWKRDLTGSVWSAPVVFKDLIFVVPNARSLVCLRTRNGDSEWWLGPRFPGPSNRPVWPNRAPPVVEDQAVLTVSLSGTVTRVDLEGRILAEATLQDPGMRDQFWSRPAVAGGTLYVASLRGRLYRLALPRLTPVERLPLHGEVQAELAARKDVLMVATTDGVLRALRARPDRTLTLWSRRLGDATSQVTPQGRLPLLPVFDEEGEVLAATRDAVLRLDPETGNVLWKAPVSGVLSPATAWKDRVLVACEDASLVVLKRSNGQLSARTRLDAPASAGPVVWGDLAVVGYPDGRVTALDLARLDPSAGGPRPQPSPSPALPEPEASPSNE